MEPSLGWSPAAAGSTHFAQYIQRKNYASNQPKQLRIHQREGRTLRWSILVLSTYTKWLLLSPSGIFPAIQAVGGEEDRQQAGGTSAEGSSPSANLWCPSHTSLVLLSLMDCSCRAGSSEGRQRLLIFSWQPPRQERWPSPSHLPGGGRAADSCTVLSDTHSKTPATNFSRFFPNLLHSHLASLLHP